jgi:hypothetical protein
MRRIDEHVGKTTSGSAIIRHFRPGTLYEKCDEPIGQRKSRQANPAA